jgi:hypothetical protein
VAFSHDKQLVIITFQKWHLTDYLILHNISVLKPEIAELLLMEYGFTAKFLEQAFDISPR